VAGRPSRRRAGRHDALTPVETVSPQEPLVYSRLTSALEDPQCATLS
jgi:hypothetical protein